MRKKKGLIALVALAVVALILGASAWAYPVFKIGGFVIEGNANTSVEDIEAATQVAVGDNLLRTDSQAVARGVSTLPWIQTVSVSKSYPSTLKISVTEREVALFAARGDGAHLIDTNGQPFVIGQPPAGTPEITGTAEDDPELFATALEIINSLDERARGRLSAIDAPSKFQFTLVFGADKQVYWGSGENLTAKAVATTAALSRDEPALDVSGAPLISVRP